MEQENLVPNLVLEMRRGTVVLVVLASLSEPMYGYNLVEHLSGTGVAVEANTLYPLLRRLESQELLTSSWNTDGAKPRKYYTLTDRGRQVLAELTQHWHAITASLEQILEEQPR